MLDFDNDGETDIFQNENGDVLVDVGSFLVIATNVDLILAFAIPPSSYPPIGAKLLWDANDDGRPDGGAILIDFNRDGNFGEFAEEPREIRVFGED